MLSFSVPLLLASWVIAACTRSTVVVALPSPPVRPTMAVNATASSELVAPTLSGDLAVAWVERGQELRLRGEAGIASETLEELPHDARGLRNLRQAAMLGSSRWMQVESASGIQGWVPSWNLTEQIEASAFCSDARVPLLLDQLRRAFLEEDGALLERLVSERRGLILRHDPWNPEIRIREAQIPELFDSPLAIDWGQRYISETAIEGTFAELFLPKAQEILGDTSVQRSCLEIQQGITQLQINWPEEYANLPYYGLYRPTPMGGNPFYWQTLVVGVEYVNGEPRIAVLLLIQPPI